MPKSFRPTGVKFSETACQIDKNTSSTGVNTDDNCWASKKCDELEKMLSDKLKGLNAIKIDEEAWQMRTELLNRYCNMLRSDIKLAFTNHVTHKLWTHGVKQFVDLFKNTVHCDTNSQITSCVDNVVHNIDPVLHTPQAFEEYGDFENDIRISDFRYTRFLEDCRGLYLGILFTVKTKYVRYCTSADGQCFDGSNSVRSIIDSLVSDPMTLLSFRLSDISTRSLLTEREHVIQNNQINSLDDVGCAVKGVIHNLLIGLGDIAFCLQHIVDARRHYLQAADIGTTIGQPYFQLALLYESVQATLSTGKQSKMFDDMVDRISEGDHRVSQIFYLIRAASVPVWFPSAIQGLDKFVDLTLANSSYMQKHKNITITRESHTMELYASFESISDFIGHFIFIFASVFKVMRMKEKKLNRSDRDAHDPDKTQMPANMSSGEFRCSDERSTTDNSIAKVDTDTDDDLPSFNVVISAIRRIREGFISVLRKQFLPSQCLIQISAISIYLVNRAFEVEKNTRVNKQTGNTVLPDFNITICASSLYIVLLEQIVRTVLVPTFAEYRSNRSAFLSSVYMLMIYAFYSDTDCESVADNIHQLETAYDFYKPTEEIIAANNNNGAREVITKSKRLKMPISFWINLGMLLSDFREPWPIYILRLFVFERTAGKVAISNS